MPTITSRDRPEIFHQDSGMGQPIVLGHSWPLNADPRVTRSTDWIPPRPDFGR